MSPEVDLARFAEAYRGGATVVDVREMDEFAAGHVPNALPIPLDRLPGRISEVPRDGAVYVICASGNRSRAGTAILRRAGIEAYSVAGGTKGWMHAGGRVVAGAV
ncbi:rhodanese-like domain-containing protein [Microtetraspora sp. AC03309]|uniref:rhodanese-like domain-containing protein n=1 Tax=Microtetraspora sp. AC03309 TaxID=2779376 RepID=UPI001E28E9A3|nr:rhodanese-like domain-containing protein [Microtetraspora sp. AC03309]MCC5580194.1 rhodanese-like domain-containing protein [Microtetraspora sp. AC03309]